MYTPQEVSEKTFPKSTGLTSGYNMTAVDEFLDGLTEDYTALYKDNTTLKAKLKMLAEKVEEYRATEDAMRSTLLAAQKMAAQMVADAQAEKEKTIADAQAQAEQILADARGEADIQARQLQQEIRDSWQKLAAAQNETADFIRRSRELCARQLTFLDSLPERGASQEEPQEEDRQPENEAVTLPALEEDAVPVADAEPVPQEEAPQPEPAAEPESQEPPREESHEEPQEEKKEEESPFPLDFKLNLEDLQFGRNYNGGDRR